MPSPFPGMDPWLENRSFWSTVHSALIHEIWREANQVLPAGYVANIGERISVVSPARNLYPDVAVVQQRDPGTVSDPTARRGSVAVCDPAWEVDLGDEEHREPYVEILAAGPAERLVTVVEVLSPSNKDRGADRDLYLCKQREVLAGGVHLLEIDLLRSGEHTLVPPRARLERHGTWDYLISLTRAKSTASTVWPVTIDEPLPRVVLPLDDADVSLELQPMIERVYEEGAFAKRIDYGRPPEPALDDRQRRLCASVLEG